MSYRSHVNGKHYRLTQGHRRFSVASNLEQPQHLATYSELLSRINTPESAEKASQSSLKRLSVSRLRWIASQNKPDRRIKQYLDNAL